MGDNTEHLIGIRSGGINGIGDGRFIFLDGDLVLARAGGVVVVGFDARRNIAGGGVVLLFVLVVG